MYDDGSCPPGHAEARACPLDAPNLYVALDRLLLEQKWNRRLRSKLVCLARAGALLQSHKREGWGFVEALYSTADSSVDYHPIVVVTPGSAGLAAHNHR